MARIDGAKVQLVAQIVKDIIADLSDRKGLGDEWDFIDGETQKAIRRTWEAIILKQLP